MKFRFTIGRRLAFGFGIIMLAIVIFSVFTYVKLIANRQLNETNSKVYVPSISKLKDLQKLANSSRGLMTQWLDNGTEDLYQDLNHLQKLYREDFKPRLTELKNKWERAEKHQMDEIFDKVEEMIVWQADVLNTYLVRKEEDVDQIIELDNIKNDRESSKGKAGGRLERITMINSGIESVITRLQEQSNSLSNQIDGSSALLQNLVMILGIVLLIFGTLIAVLTFRSIVKPIIKLKTILVSMGKGILPRDHIEERGDEIGEMSHALENLIKGLRETSDFSKKIGEGEFDSKYAPLSEDDILGNSLLLMRDNLASVAEEDKKRSWATEGLAKFGEILRRNNTDLKMLTESVIFELTKYLGANQGAIFVINEEDESQHLEIAACYAWDRHKFLEQKVSIGDGLVGQSWQEMSTFYLTDVPSDYVNITSGLGQASPTSILIVPMMVNEEIYGVIELASFNELEQHQIEFCEKLAENIAATISTVRVNERTKSLLTQSQDASEQLRAQEEELRQNQEEMMATQEEMQRNLDEAHEEIERLKEVEKRLRKELKD